MKRQLAVLLACVPAPLSGCATGGRDQDLVRCLFDEAAGRANASAQGGLNVRPFVLSIDAAGAIHEWSSNPGFGNIPWGVAEMDDTMRALLERAHQNADHRAFVWVGYDLGPDGRAGEMILAVRDVSGQVSEQRRPLVRRARVELPFANR